MDRLQTIFLVLSKLLSEGKCNLFIDVGSDHGLIAEFMTDKADKVIATDISDICLNKARALLSGKDNVSFCCCDGLEGIESCPDIVAICGMGGINIAEILANSRIIDAQTRLVLQAQSKVNLLRKFLCDNDYTITDDITAFDGRRYYDIIGAKKGNEQLSELQIEYGKFYSSGEETLMRRLRARRQAIASYKPTPANKAKLEDIEGILFENSQRHN